MMAPLAMGFDAPRKLRVVGAREGGRDVEDIPAAELQRALFGEGALAAPGAAENQDMERYGASSKSTSCNVRTSRSFSSFFRTATRKKPDPSP